MNIWLTDEKEPESYAEAMLNECKVKWLEATQEDEVPSARTRYPTNTPKILGIICALSYPLQTQTTIMHNSW